MFTKFQSGSQKRNHDELVENNANSNMQISKLSRDVLYECFRRLENGELQLAKQTCKFFHEIITDGLTRGLYRLVDYRQANLNKVDIKEIKSFCFTPDKEFFACHGDNNSIKIYSAKNFQTEIKCITLDPAICDGLQFISNNMLALNINGQIEFHDIVNNTITHSYETWRGCSSFSDLKFKFLANGQFYIAERVALTHENFINFYDTRNGGIVKKLGAYGTLLDISNDGRYVVCKTYREILVSNAFDCHIIKIELESGVNSVKFSSDNQHIIIINNAKNHVKIYELSTLTLLIQLDGVFQEVHLSHDKSLTFAFKSANTGSFDALTIYHTDSKKVLNTIEIKEADNAFDRILYIDKFRILLGGPNSTNLLSIDFPVVSSNKFNFKALAKAKKDEAEFQVKHFKND